ncbi:MAG: YihA family ribosome biogenesis GTP-binding protein [Gammaproteobacteria bacterium]|nr:YihA family ribosome biogenesis GTP-binding protein [Gammaproteobacteria bacterium]
MESPERYRTAQFVTGAASASGFLADSGLEVAFAGRSNAGKSSAINALTGRRALARTSKTPGRTREINFFALDERRRLVDLPGYGFAKAPKSEQARWARTIQTFMVERQSLRGLVLLVDSRHPITSLDRSLIQWCLRSGVPVHCLLTKADKLGRNKASQALAAAVRDYRQAQEQVSFQLFSAVSRFGLERLVQQLDVWLDWEAEGVLDADVALSSADPG